MLNLIKKLNVPKVVLRYMMINFLDMDTIKNVILNVKEMNILDNFSKEFLSKAKKGFLWNCSKGRINVAQWLWSLGRVDAKATTQPALKGQGGINIHADDEAAFRCSCG